MPVAQHGETAQGCVPDGPLPVHVRGRGVPLVVLPSFGVTHEVMSAAFEPALRGAPGSTPACRRLYVELPGTGGAAAAAPTSEAVLTGIVGALDRELGARRFLLAGWSYGGYLAVGLARRLGPRVGGLAVVCAGPRVRAEDRDLAGVAPSAEEAGWLAGVPEELHGYFRLAVGRQTRAVAHRVAAALARTGPRDDAYLAALRGEGFALRDEDEPLRYAGPVTVLAGRADRVAGYRDAFALLESCPDAEYRAFAGAGHFLPLEDPVGFAAAMRSWLRRCAGAEARARVTRG